MSLFGTFGVRRIVLIAAPLALILGFGMMPAGLATPANCQQRNSCVLVFTAQPTDAQVGVPITSTSLNTGGGSVQVQVQLANADGSPSGTPVAGISDTISLELVMAPTNSAATVGLQWDNPTVTDATGTAQFSNLKIDTHGSYRLTAVDVTNSRGVLPSTSVAPLSSSAVSPYFTIWDDVQTCPPSCTSNPPSTADETVVVSFASTNGTLASSLGADNKDKYLKQNGTLTEPCGAPARLKAQFGPAVTAIGGALTGSGTKTVTLTYRQTYVNLQANNGASFYQICYQPAPGEQFQDINNQTVTGPNVGLLPYPCGSTTKPFSKANPVSAPCIVSKTKNSGSGTVTIVLSLPLTDPKVI